MKFGWISLCGGLTVALLMIPNILFAIRSPKKEKRYENRWLNAIEQLGRYGCIVFMWLPLFVWEFRFQSKLSMLLYTMGSTVLLLFYFMIWRFFFKNPSGKYAVFLAVIPVTLFLLCGILLRHPALIVSAVLFGVGHIGITLRWREFL